MDISVNEMHWQVIKLRQLYTLAYRLTGDVETAMKLAEEVSIHLFLDGHREDCSTRLNLKGIKTSCSFYLRRYKNLAGQKLVQESVHRIQQALNILPPEEKVAVVLRDTYGLSCVEVGSVLNWSQEKVHSTIARGRYHLCRYLEEKEDIATKI